MLALHQTSRGGFRPAAVGLGLALAGAGGAGCDRVADRAALEDGSTTDVVATADRAQPTARAAPAHAHARSPAMCMTTEVADPQDPEAGGDGQPEDTLALQRDRERVVLELARALDARMTVWKRADGSPIHVAHCRALDEGCRARIVAFARMFADAAMEHDLDPFLIAAVAVKESALSPLATGPRGSAGILQLNPRGVGRDLRVVRSPHYRAWCARHRVDACQAEVVDRGARHLSQWIHLCEDVAAGLGGYNTGQCGRIGYSRRVIHIQKELMDLARETEGPAAWVSN